VPNVTTNVITHHNRAGDDLLARKTVIFVVKRCCGLKIWKIDHSLLVAFIQIENLPVDISHQPSAISHQHPIIAHYYTKKQSARCP
jgi:hypothetical protein